MRYLSTRGAAHPLGFADILLAGPAPDGGLYLPEHWPQVARTDIGSFARLPYAEVAYRVMRPFIGDAFSAEEFRADVDAAYATFDHAAVAPLVQLAPDRYLLELFHGPTLAFKDIAMQLLGRMFARALVKRGARATVVVATSGDTGSAAIAALKGQPNVDVVVLHPKGRVSDVQRRQMTTAPEGNVHNIALEGTFDDTQNIVKALFADESFAPVPLAAVNSINFARIVAQCVYYFTAAAALGAGPGRAVNFVVPTGNFGDVFAGEAASYMGLETERLVVATNSNDILARALGTGVYAAGTAHPTLSPSMDIQVASNFERALFEASARDAKWTSGAMTEFARSRALTIPHAVLKQLQQRYLAASASDDEVLAAIARVHRDSGVVIDPHTAVGVVAADKMARSMSGPVVLLATAHPAKFPDAIRRAIGRAPEMPARLAEALQGKERLTVLPNDIGAVRQFIRERIKP